MSEHKEIWQKINEKMKNLYPHGSMTVEKKREFKEKNIDWNKPVKSDDFDSVNNTRSYSFSDSAKDNDGKTILTSGKSNAYHVHEDYKRPETGEVINADSSIVWPIMKGWLKGELSDLELAANFLKAKDFKIGDIGREMISNLEINPDTKSESLSKANYLAHNVAETAGQTFGPSLTGKYKLAVKSMPKTVKTISKGVSEAYDWFKDALTNGFKVYNDNVETHGKEEAEKMGRNAFDDTLSITAGSKISNKALGFKKIDTGSKKLDKQVEAGVKVQSLAKSSVTNQAVKDHVMDKYKPRPDFDQSNQSYTVEYPDPFADNPE